MAVTTRKHPAASSKRQDPAPPAPGVEGQGPTRKEQYAAGKALRESCPRDAHAAWKAASPAGPAPVPL